MTEIKAKYDAGQQQPEPPDLHALLAEVERLRLALETEQHAKWGAEQDVKHWQEEAETLRLQIAQLAEALEVATQ